MTLEQLQKFCSTDETRPSLERPFSQDGWTYATDGRIAVRVRELPDVPPTEFNPPVMEPVFQACWAEGIEFQRAELPPRWEELELPRVKCSDCKGMGHFSKCRECDGESQTECLSCGHMEDCRECNEHGFVPSPQGDGTVECRECDGVGWYEGACAVALSRGQVVADLRYLRLVATLPDVELLFFDAVTPMRIVFTGGQGILMPMRRDAVSQLEELVQNQWQEVGA